jgi:arginine:ornithine antiporter/lysine permease
MNLIPYLLVVAYGLQIARRSETYEMRPEERTRDLVIADIATLYTAFMIYAGGLKFVLLAALLYTPGTVLYFWARREQNTRVFKPAEVVIFLVVVVGALVCVYWLATSYITI